MSAKRRSQIPERQALRERVLERSSRCEANLDTICSYHATDVHEIKTRARGGSILDDDNCVGLCRNCHRWITDHPAWALEHGFMVHSWATEADMIAAQRARVMWTRGVMTVSDDDPF